MNSMIISSTPYNYMLRKIFTEVEEIKNCTQVHDYALPVPPLAGAPWCQRTNVARENRTRPVMASNRFLMTRTPNTAAGRAYPTRLVGCPHFSLFAPWFLSSLRDSTGIFLNMNANG